MRKLATISFALFLCSAHIHSRQPDKNITIQEATEEYSFVKGKRENPILVKETQENVYFCNEYRTNIPIAEFYDNQVEINDVDIWVNGDRDKRTMPRYEPYTNDGIFHSDAKVCYFELPFLRKGTTSKVRFHKTVLD